VKNTAIVFISIVITLAIFDITAYLLLPTSLAKTFSAYRVSSEHRTVTWQISRGYPRYYFVADPELGFDIAPNAKGLHSGDDYHYEVFSNAAGCFDQNPPTLYATSDYYYFAGDSFTWGYSPYDKKFATIFEKRSGIPSAKCGVTHTGTLHQYGKFKRFTQLTGRYPAAVLAGFFPNDIANDFAHPHTTVIDGYQVNTKILDAKNQRIISLSIAEAETKYRAIVDQKRRESQSTWSLLKQYSLLANMAKEIRKRIVSILPDGHDTTGTSSDTEFYGITPGLKKALGYDNLALTQVNRGALVTWKADSIENNYRLVILLIPDKYSFKNIRYFDGLKDFLDSISVDYLDLAVVFHTGNHDVSEIYLPNDGHFSENGNLVVANALIEYFAPGQISSQRSKPDQPVPARKAD
jgi:hypothetical protein